MTNLHPLTLATSRTSWGEIRTRPANESIRVPNHGRGQHHRAGLPKRPAGLREARPGGADIINDHHRSVTRAGPYASGNVALSPSCAQPSLVHPSGRSDELGREPCSQFASGTGRQGHPMIQPATSDSGAKRGHRHHAGSRGYAQEVDGHCQSVGQQTSQVKAPIVLEGGNQFLQSGPVVMGCHHGEIEPGTRQRVWYVGLQGVPAASAGAPTRLTTHAALRSEEQVRAGHEKVGHTHHCGRCVVLPAVLHRHRPVRDAQPG